MPAPLECSGSSQLLKRKRGETSTHGFGEPRVKKLRDEEVEDPEEQWRLRMRKARKLKEHNRAMVREASDYAPLEVSCMLTFKSGPSSQSWCQETHGRKSSTGYCYSGV